MLIESVFHFLEYDGFLLCFVNNSIAYALRPRTRGNPDLTPQEFAEEESPMDDCPFCEETPMKEREFYRVVGWYAVLDHRPMADGHVLLVARRSGAECPVELNQLKSS